MLEISKLHPEMRFFVIVPTIALRDQWELDAIDELGVSKDEIYSHGSNKKLKRNHRIVLMVINSARERSSLISSEGKWMLIVDECHRAASEENRKSIQGKWAATLGLSATPERQYDDWFEEHIKPQLGNVIANYGYIEARRDGVISDFELRNYKVPLTDNEKVEMGKLSKSIAIERMYQGAKGNTEPSDLLLNLLLKRSRISQRAENRIPLAIAICRKFQGERMLIFHEFTDAADQITRVLDEIGFREVVIIRK